MAGSRRSESEFGELGVMRRGPFGFSLSDESLYSDNLGGRFVFMITF